MKITISDHEFLELMDLQYIELSKGLIHLFREQGKYDVVELLIFSSCCINLLIQTFELPEDKVKNFIEKFSLHEMMDISMRTKIELGVLTELNSERFSEYAPLINNMMTSDDNEFSGPLRVYDMGVCLEKYITGKQPDSVNTTMRAMQIFSLINAAEAALLESIA